MLRGTLETANFLVLKSLLHARGQQTGETYGALALPLAESANERGETRQDMAGLHGELGGIAVIGAERRPGALDGRSQFCGARLFPFPSNEEGQRDVENPREGVDRVGLRVARCRVLDGPATTGLAPCKPVELLARNPSLFTDKLQSFAEHVNHIRHTIRKCQTLSTVEAVRWGVMMLGVTTLEQRLKACGPIAEIARKANTHRQTLYKAFAREAEGESHNLEFDTAQALAKATGKHVLWILTGEDPGVDSFRLAQMVAHWLSQSHELDTLEAWALMQSLEPKGTSVDEIFAAAAAKLVELGIPQRVRREAQPPSKPATKAARR